MWERKNGYKAEQKKEEKTGQSTRIESKRKQKMNCT